MPSTGSHAAGRFLLRLDGDGGDPAYLRAVAGGGLGAPVVADGAAADRSATKRLGRPAVDPIAFELGLSMAAPVLRWIGEGWRRRPSRRDGAVVHADAGFAARHELGFHRALVTEARFPALDGAAREPAYLGCSILPEWTALRAGDGEVVRGAVGRDSKRWLASSFRLAIDGVDCRHVSRVEGFTVTQRVRTLAVGGRRGVELVAAGVEFPDLDVAIATEHAGDLVAWHRASLDRGGRGATRDGALELLSADRRDVLMTIGLAGLRIAAAAVDRCEAGADVVRRTKVRLAVEAMEVA